MSQHTSTVDLKPYFAALVQRWWLIGLTTALAVALGLLWTTLRTSTYQATALIAVTQSRPALRLDDVEILNNGQEPLGVIYASLPQLAMGDDVISHLLAQTTYFDESETPYSSLRGRLVATPITNPSLVGLSVSLEDQQEATRLANIWAALVIDHANQLFDGYGDEQTKQYEQQFAQLDSELFTAQAALADFEGQNAATALQNQLDALEAQHNTFLADRSTVERFSLDIEAFISQQLLRSAAEAATLSDQLTLFALQSKALSIESQIPVQLTIAQEESFDEMTVGKQLILLEGLQSATVSLSEKLSQKIELLIPEIAARQGQLQTISNEADLLHRQVEVSGEARTALARKFEEARIAANTTNKSIQSASSASIPEFPTNTRRLVIVAGAAIVGMLLGVFSVVSFCWLQQVGYLIKPLRVKKGPVEGVARSISP